jgi:hypothetical protein
MKSDGSITTVRLDIEENQLLRVAGKIGLKGGSCKAHEIWIFSKTETDRICRQVLREAPSWSSFWMMAMRT